MSWRKHACIEEWKTKMTEKGVYLLYPESVYENESIKESALCNLSSVLRRACL